MSGHVKSEKWINHDGKMHHYVTLEDGRVYVDGKLVSGRDHGHDPRLMRWGVMWCAIVIVTTAILANFVVGPIWDYLDP